MYQIQSIWSKCILPRIEYVLMLGAWLGTSCVKRQLWEGNIQTENITNLNIMKLYLSNNSVVFSGLCHLIFSIWSTSYILISLCSYSISATRDIFIDQTTIFLIYEVTVNKSMILWRHIEWSNSTRSDDIKIRFKR